MSQALTGIRETFDNKYIKQNKEWVFENQVLNVREEMNKIQVEYFRS